MSYNGSIELISGITQKNGGSFPLVDASAVRVDDNTNLDAQLNDLKNRIEALEDKISIILSMLQIEQ